MLCCLPVRHQLLLDEVGCGAELWGGLWGRAALQPCAQRLSRQRWGHFNSLSPISHLICVSENLGLLGLGCAVGGSSHLCFGVGEALLFSGYSTSGLLLAI